MNIFAIIIKGISLLLIVITLIALSLNAIYKFLYDYDCTFYEIFDMKDMLHDWFGIK